MWNDLYVSGRYKQIFVTVHSQCCINSLLQSHVNTCARSRVFPEYAMCCLRLRGIFVGRMTNLLKFMLNIYKQLQACYSSNERVHLVHAPLLTSPATHKLNTTVVSKLCTPCLNHPTKVCNMTEYVAKYAYQENQWKYPTEFFIGVKCALLISRNRVNGTYLTRL